MHTQPRRWFQFSLCTMFAVTTLVAVFLGRLASEMKAVQHRKSIYAEITEGFGRSRPELPGAVPSFRRMIGDQRYSEIALSPGSSQAELERAQAAFPEAEVYIALDGDFVGACFRSKE